MLALVLRPHARISTASTAAEALALCERVRMDVAFVDVGLAGAIDGIELLERLRSRPLDLEVIMCSVDRSVETVVRAIKAGAFAYLTKDFTAIQEAPAYLERAMSRRQERRTLAATRLVRTSPEPVGCETEPMRTVFGQLALAASTVDPVLLLGEAGTGKSMLAEHVHALSARGQGPYVSVQAATVMQGRAEQMLLTDAVEGGTLYIEEVGELDEHLQGLVLDLLAEPSGTPDESAGPRGRDVRIIASSSTDLDAAVRQGRLRPDLHRRLATHAVQVPPLRTRLHDLPELVAACARKHARRWNRSPPAFSPESIATLACCPWPGNVRELDNLVEQMVVASDRPMIEPRDLPIEYRLDQISSTARSAGAPSNFTVACEAFERTLLEAALRRTGGGLKAAARDLGLPYSSFKYKLRKHGLL